MNRVNKFLLAGAAALGLAGFAGSAAARVDVQIGLGYPGPVYYDEWQPTYREYYYSAPRPVYYYYDRGPSYRYYDRRPVYHYYHDDRRWGRDHWNRGNYRDDHRWRERDRGDDRRDNWRDHRDGHDYRHESGHNRGNDRSWSDSHDRRYGNRR